MRITELRLGKLCCKLRVPFKTALRTVEKVEDVILEAHTDTGHIGYGEAPPTGVITGDTMDGILGAFRSHIAPALMGGEVDDFEALMLKLDACAAHNTSAKAAADMALYDLYGQLYNIPVYKLLGGAKKRIETDITISVNPPDEMARDARDAVERGYKCLKIKVGKDVDMDFERLKAVRAAAGGQITLRIDANQGWSPREAVNILNRLQEAGLDIELVEQPVKARDIVGLKFVTERSLVPVLADESVFSPMDAMEILHSRAADMINIKLMKCGGIHNALKIAAAAEVYGVECMLGCMLEAKISVNAAAHLACAKRIITRVDLDGPVLLAEDPVIGGATFDESQITLSDAPGLGIRGIEPSHIVYFDTLSARRAT